jgi:hypothetical protein
MRKVGAYARVGAYASFKKTRLWRCSLEDWSLWNEISNPEWQNLKASSFRYILHFSQHWHVYNFSGEFVTDKKFHPTSFRELERDVNRKNFNQALFNHFICQTSSLIRNASERLKRDPPTPTSAGGGSIPRQKDVLLQSQRSLSSEANIKRTCLLSRQIPRFLDSLRGQQLSLKVRPPEGKIEACDFPVIQLSAPTPLSEAILFSFHALLHFSFLFSSFFFEKKFPSTSFF